MRKIPIMKALSRHAKSCMFSVFCTSTRARCSYFRSPLHCTRHPLCGDRHIVCDLYVRCSNITIIWHVTDLYSSANIVRVIKSRRMRWVGHVERVGERRGVYRVLMVKPEGKKPLGRTRCRWKDNVKKHLQEVGCRGMDWIDLAREGERWRSFECGNGTVGFHKMRGIS